MTTPSPGAIAATQVAYDAGFRGRSLVQMVALAGAESNYNPAAINDNPKTKDYSVGYWQINYFGDLAQSRTSQFGPASGLVGSDPTGAEAHRNAKAAYALSGGGVSLSPWAADFNNGRYYQQLPDAEAAVSQFLGGNTMAGAVGSPYQYATSTGVPPVSNPSTGAGVDTPPSQSTEQDHCLLKFPGIAGVGSFCLLSTNSARAIGGGAILVAGGIVGLFGVMLLAGKSTDITGVLGKVSPSGWVGAVAASSKRQQGTDPEEQYYQRVTSEQANDTGRQGRARKAFRGESREPFTDADRTLRR